MSINQLATQVEPVQPVHMPQIDLPDDLLIHIQKRAAAKGCSESEVIADLLNLPSERIKAHPLVAFTSSAFPDPSQDREISVGV